ncbi:kinase-like protein [Pholiota conissans]|uniref:Kinase-like protein n=1 Tax=Pholiota conissans TaxID=109636 RepID=A0A9P6CMF3_9AGAR|nr:kinase-like protein [Pholiota conissans]
MTFGKDSHDCIFTWDGFSKAYFTDLSKGGILVNDKKIGYNLTIRIRDGSEIAFGKWKYIYCQVSGCAKPPAPSPVATQALALSSDPSPSFTLPPTLAKQYKFDRILGNGGFGFVVGAKHRHTGEYHALKMIDLDGLLAVDPTAAERVKEEVDNLLRVKHPHVCRIHGSILDAGSGILTMLLEYMEGGDLWDYIHEFYQNGMPEESVKHIAYQICDAMAYVHSKGIMHRDLKPANILLTQGIPPLVKIADFGLSKKSKPDKSYKHHTICGTVKYIAPEVVGNGLYDDRVDCYSVGVIIYFLLTSCNPYQPHLNKFKDEEGESLLIKHVEERVLDTSLLQRKDISENARNIVSCLLSDSPDRRLSMQGVLNSPWFDGYQPYYGRSIYAKGRITPAAAASPPQAGQRKTERHQAVNVLPHRNHDASPRQKPAHVDTNHGRVPPQPMPYPRLDPADAKVKGGHVHVDVKGRVPPQPIPLPQPVVHKGTHAGNKHTIVAVNRRAPPQPMPRPQPVVDANFKGMQTEKRPANAEANGRVLPQPIPRPRPAVNATHESKDAAPRGGGTPVEDKRQGRFFHHPVNVVVNAQAHAPSQDPRGKGRR